MKKTLLRILALTLALLALPLSLLSCGKHGQTMIEVEGYDISVNLYMLYLSRMKGSMSMAGEDVKNAKFWQGILDYETGETVADFNNAKVLEGLVQIAASLYLYDDLGLSLPRETEKSIDEWIDALIEEVGDGSKAQLNSVLSQYGANVTVLRDASIIEAKIEQLKNHLYGEDGALLTALAREQFYQNNYLRGRVLIINNYYNDHDRDKEGNAIYYEKDGVHIAYDEEKGVPTNEKDKNGDTVYRLVNEDGSTGRIAYDEKGTIKYYTDKDGNYQKAYYTDEEMENSKKALEEIAEKCQGKPELFLRCIEDYSDQLTVIEKVMPNGMYFAEGSYTTDSAFYTFAKELEKLKDGELVLLSQSDGYYLLMRESLDEEAWNVGENSVWFSSLTTLCVESMLRDRVQEYIPLVKVDESLAGSVSIADIGVNTYY